LFVSLAKFSNEKEEVQGEKTVKNSRVVSLELPTYFDEYNEFCFVFPSEFNEQTQNMFIENFKGNALFKKFTLIDINKNFTFNEYDNNICNSNGLSKFEIEEDSIENTNLDYEIDESCIENTNYEMKIEVAKSEEEMNAKYKSVVLNSNITGEYIGVQFYGIVFTTPTKYTIYHNSDYELNKLLKYYDTPFDGLTNIRSTFYLQSVIDKTIIKTMMSNSVNSVGGNTQDFHISRKFLDTEGYSITVKKKSVQGLIPFIMIFYFVPCICCLLNHLVIEKESKIKESLVIIGLKRSMFWASWIVIYGIIIVVSAFLVTLTMNFTNFYVYIKWGVTITILLIFGMTCCCISFILSTLIKKSKTANIVGVMIIVFFFTLFFLSTFLSGTSKARLLCNLFLSPLAFLSLFNDLNKLEELKLPTSFTSLYNNSALRSNFLCLIFSLILYFILAVYLDNVLPQGNNYNKKWYFFITEPFRLCSRRKSKEVSKGYYNHQNPFIQEDPEGLEKSVSVKNVGKTFKMKGEKIKVLNNINFNAYYNEIFAILGHNGAGKTTLMNIMTGILSASHGEVYYDDIPITGHETEICKNFGYCPQFDTFNNKLTVGEHVKLYAGIKNIEVDVDEILKEIDLLEKKNTFPNKLSGGQKRKLCITLALLGSPKYVFLDEPTTGLDPYSRKSIWELLLKRKNGCTIFITTHYMDEADLLADRKMVLSEGNITCLGTSLFLKNCFNMNYTLDINCKDFKDCSLADSMIEHYCPGAIQTKFVTTTKVNVDTKFKRKNEKIIQDDYIISYLLPMKYSGLFNNIFGNLNNIIKDNNNSINNYSLTAPTLEELFIKLEGKEERVDPSMSNVQNMGSNQQDNIYKSDKPNNNYYYSSEGDSDQGLVLKKKTATTINIDQENLLQDLDPIFKNNSIKRRSSSLTQIYEIVKLRLIIFFRNKSFALPYVLIPICLIFGAFYFFNRSIERSNEDYKDIKKHYEPMTIVPNIYEEVKWFKDTPGSSGQALNIIQNIGTNPKLSADDINYEKELVLDAVNSFPNNLNYIGGFTGTVDGQNNLQFTIHTNYTYTFSAPIAINIIDNAMMDYYNIKESISTTYHPLDEVKVFGFDSNDEELIINRYKGMENQEKEPIILVAVGLAISLSISIYGPYTVKEREEGITHQLFLNGTKRLNYWLGILISDCICMLIPVISIGIVCNIFDLSIFNKKIVVYVIIMSLIWIVGSLLHQYIVGYFFKSYEKISTLLIIINPILILGIGIYIYSISNQLLDIDDLDDNRAENATILSLYLYDIYPVLFLFTPGSILLIYIKLWACISRIKDKVKGNEISTFLNLPECTKILARKDLTHDQKSDIITKLFFTNKIPSLSTLLKQREGFVLILITFILVVIIFALILFVLEKYSIKRLRKSEQYSEKEREIQNKKLETGATDVYNEWKRVKQDLEEGENSNGNIALKVYQINKDFSMKKSEIKKKMKREEKERKAATQEFEIENKINETN